MKTLLKTILFHLLLTFRGIIVGVSRLLALGCIGVIITTFYVERFSALPFRVKFEIVVLGIVFTIIYWFYDYLIFYLRPSHNNSRHI